MFVPSLVITFGYSSPWYYGSPKTPSGNRLSNFAGLGVL